MTRQCEGAWWERFYWARNWTVHPVNCILPKSVFHVLPPRSSYSTLSFLLYHSAHKITKVLIGQSRHIHWIIGVCVCVCVLGKNGGGTTLTGNFLIEATFQREKRIISDVWYFPWITWDLIQMFNLQSQISDDLWPLWPGASGGPTLPSKSLPICLGIKFHHKGASLLF